MIINNVNNTDQKNKSRNSYTMLSFYRLYLHCTHFVWFSLWNVVRHIITWYTQSFIRHLAQGLVVKVSLNFWSHQRACHLEKSYILTCAKITKIAKTNDKVIELRASL